MTFLIFLLLVACQKQPTGLIDPISNNAVASAVVDNETWFYSFNGLLAGKQWTDVSSNAYAYNLKKAYSKKLNKVPGLNGRLASVAATVNNKIYIFGGYTVAEDHTEISTEEVYQFDPIMETYRLVSKMPTPVDDSVALVYKQRYIYLISGWHNDGNVNLVQVFDTKDMSWHQATPFPGAPVFGQAAAIVDNQFIVSDGVKVAAVKNGRRQYAISSASYLGVIQPDDFTTIKWTKTKPHPGPARYRMAASGSKSLNKAIFVGGSDNPYNFNGIGYNQQPSQPSAMIFAYDFKQKKWQTLGKQLPATMDHRALLEAHNEFYTVGGMLNNQQTTNQIFKIELN